jgi:hypothetical protein
MTLPKVAVFSLAVRINAGASVILRKPGRVEGAVSANLHEKTPPWRSTAGLRLHTKGYGGPSAPWVYSKTYTQIQG